MVDVEDLAVPAVLLARHSNRPGHQVAVTAKLALLAADWWALSSHQPLATSHLPLATIGAVPKNRQEEQRGMAKEPLGRCLTTPALQNKRAASRECLVSRAR